MAEHNLGPYRFRSRGEFSPTARYKFMDVVTYNGSSYYVYNEDIIDNISVTGVAPVGQYVSETYWRLLAAKGDTGSAGSSGDTYLPFITVTNGIWNYEDSDKIIIPSEGSASIQIQNAYEGCVGIILTEKELTLPSGSDYSIDYNYVTKVANQYYMYTFLYANPDGANARFIWNRTVVNKS